MAKFIFILLFLFSFLEAKIHIAVTYPFQKNLIERISNDEFVIHVVHRGHKKFEHLEKRELNELIYSNAYFTLGLEEEKKYIEMFKAKNKYLKIIDTTKNIKKDIVNGKENPYIWMDPILVRDFAKNIYNELLVLMSYKKYLFKENYEIFLKELDDIFLQLKKKLDETEYYNIYVYKPYWHYFAKRFRLNLYYKEERFMVAPEVKETITFARKNDISKVLVDKETSFILAQALGNHINADIIENNIHEYNWRLNLYSLTRKIVKRKRR